MRPVPSVLFLSLTFFAATARAESTQPDTVPAPRLAPGDIRSEIPIVGYSISAFGSSRVSGGVAGFVGVVGSQDNGDPTQVGHGIKSGDAAQLGGGARIWVSPLTRLTIIAQVDRDYFGKAAPSATVAVRLLGSRAQGWALGAAATYKTEGFKELVGEVELSTLFSAMGGGWHADANLVFGTGLGEEGDSELDGEIKLRAGYDVARWLRVGFDARGRYRLAGDGALPGNRIGDFVGGPEVVVSYAHFFFAASTGPSTVGVAGGLGWSGTGTFGGAFF
jgi:hypothetical protein